MTLSLEPFKPFDELEDEQKLVVARSEYRDARSSDWNFQRQARKCNKFYAGDQYTAAEKSELDSAGRPALVGNLVKSTVELIKGINDMNRVKAHVVPTERNDGFLADVLNDCYDKIHSISYLAEREDDALENNIITGSGYCAVDIAPDPKRPGEIKIPVVSVPVSEIHEDPDGRYIFWEKWISFEDFAIQYPKFAKDLEEIISEDGEFFDEDSLDDQGDTAIDKDYDRPLEDGFYDKTKGLVKVIHKEYWSTYDRYYASVSGKVIEIEKDKKSFLKKQGVKLQTIKDKKVKWFQFIGDRILFDGDSPLPFDGFSIVSEHAYSDKSKDRKVHFGIVKDLIDPQREANKRWSQTLNLFLQQSQGGYFVEAGAIYDAKQWADTINTPGADTIVKDDAISSGKIKEKRLPELPAASLQLNEFAQDMLKKISGVNPDLLGQVQGNQDPGIVVKMRQQQGLMLLNNIFTAHKRLIHKLSERIYSIIMAYMPDSQILRILGDGKEYAFRGNLIVNLRNKTVAPIRNIRDLQYNIEVIDAPNNTTKNMAQLSIFLNLVKTGFPVDPKVIVEKLDITETEKIRWLEYIDNMQKSQSQQSQAAMQMKQQLEGSKLQIEKGKLQLSAEKIMTDRASENHKLEQKELNDRRTFDIELAKLDTQSRSMIMDLVAKLSQPMQLPESTNAYTDNVSA